MIKRKRIIPESTKLNLIPIMDAVFIFIFFLLLSAQFVKIFELETQSPLVREVPSDENLKKEPLNLRIKITADHIQVQTGIDNTLRKEFNRNEQEHLVELKKFVMQLRKENAEDDYVIISPNSNVRYEDIIVIIDSVRALPAGQDKMQIESDDGLKTIYNIFSQIVLEPLNET